MSFNISLSLIWNFGNLFFCHTSSVVKLAYKTLWVNLCIWTAKIHKL